MQDQRGLLDKIEDFCSMPDFTDSISDFAAQHSQEFATGPIEGEHPVRHTATAAPPTAATTHANAPHGSSGGTSSTCSTRR